MEELFVDAENYRGTPEGYGYKDIVMEQVKRVVRNMSQEMRSGFWVYSHVEKRTSERIKYFGDSRKELSQSIDVLHDLLLPKFDKKIDNRANELNEKISKIKEDSSSEKEYWAKKLNVYRELFQELCLFLDRLGWLESESFEE